VRAGGVIVNAVSPYSGPHLRDSDCRVWHGRIADFNSLPNSPHFMICTKEFAVMSVKTSHERRGLATKSGWNDHDQEHSARARARVGGWTRRWN
jgi:hypothetical protein